MATTKDYRLGEFTYPRGWFMIAEACELNTYKPLAVRFLARTLPCTAVAPAAVLFCWMLTAPT